jgi:hypothetical protein
VQVVGDVQDRAQRRVGVGAALDVVEVGVGAGPDEVEADLAGGESLVDA